MSVWGFQSQECGAHYQFPSKVVLTISLILMSLKPDQAELASGKRGAGFSITYMASAGRFGQVGHERRQREQLEVF
jgi:Na+/melibiose symporter-like transporter